MEPKDKEGEILLPRHEQQSLCTTRLPYRQGRRLTAVKVYTVNNESNHLLVFGVPSLNLRQETKALFAKFGKLLQFNISKDHAAEVFTETYHVKYEKIQSARLAKRMLDTKNFYGGSLHVCYSPELEDVNETRNKLLQRQKDVMFRLRNLFKDANDKVQEKVKKVLNNPVSVAFEPQKVNMGDINTINLENNSIKKRKKHQEPIVKEKRYKPCFVSNSFDNNDEVNLKCDNVKNDSDFINDNHLEIVDCTSNDLESVTNLTDTLNNGNAIENSLNDHLNYNKFGNEVIRKVPVKSVNKIKFSLNNKR